MTERVRLAVQRRGEVLSTVDVGERPVMLGRTPDNDVPLDDIRVSRQHAELRLTPDGLMVTDLGSVNGSYIDGSRLPPNAPFELHPGATLRIGPFAVLHSAPSDAAAAQAQPRELAAATAAGDRLQTRELGAPIGSLAALREAHAALLERRRADGEDAAVHAAAADLIRQGAAAGALLDNDAERRAAQSLLDFWANLLYRAGAEPPEATLAEFDLAQAPELPDDICPYVGLDAFRESNVYMFFGRRRLVEEMVERLRDHRLLAVVGPSGSGKSSVVQAGLVPALQAGAVPGSEGWIIRPPIVPGAHPLQAIARQLRPRTAVGSWTNLAVEQLRSKEISVADLAATSAGTPVVVVVDQFEETFTLCTDDEERRRFIDNLIGLATGGGPRHSVVLTMRSDFETYVAREPALQALFQAGRVQVTPMSAGELREAVERPADMVGLKFEPGLVDLLLQEIVGEPAALPLLQFTLLQLWGRRERNRVTMAAYRSVGGGRLALARAADSLYDGLIPEEQVTARRILLRMVRPGEGLEVTSARVGRPELAQIGEDPGRVERVLAKLIGARLLRLTPGRTPAETQVEVAHEALIRNWPRLVEWLDEEREWLRRRRRLTAAAGQWEALGRDAGALLRGAALEEAERYGDLSERERAFVAASRGDAERAAREHEEQQRRELEQARALAEEQRRRADQQEAVARRMTRIAWLAIAQVLIYIPLFIGISSQNSGLWQVCFWLLVATGITVLVLAARGRFMGER